MKIILAGAGLGTLNYSERSAMPDDSNSRPTVERWLALLVRYWAFNMTLVHNQGVDWPGFGYTDDEKAEMKSISEKYPSVEFYAWLGLTVIFAIAIFAGVALAGMSLLSYTAGGEKNVANTPESLFYLAFALQLLVSLSLGFPLDMLPAAALVGKFFAVKNDDLPASTATAHYFHKLWFQIARIAAVVVALCVTLWIFVPGDSKFFVVLRLVIPMLSPAVTALTAAYFLTARKPSGEIKGA